MKKRALRKEFFMEIKKSLPRFLSIFFIVALGTAFYSGIQSAAPDMRYSGDAYFDEKKLMDLKVVSTLGLTAEDVDALLALPGVEAAEGSRFTDVLTGEEGNVSVLRFESVPEKMNLPVLVQGRMPDKQGECLLDADYAASKGFKVGDTLHVTESGEEEDHVLKTHSFVVAGTVSSPQYIAFSRGNTNVGNGEISGFAYVAEETFDADYYMQIYLKVRNAEETISYLDGYRTLVSGAKVEVEGIQAEREDARYEEIKGEAQEELADARQELADGKKEAEEELASAKEELDDGRKELADGKQKLADARQELADGKQELANSRQKLADSERQLADGERELAEAKEELSKQKKSFQKKKTKAEKQIKAGEKQLAAGKKELKKNKKNFQTQKTQFLQQKSEYEKSLADYGKKKDEYDAGMAQLAQGRGQYAQAERQLETARENYAALQAVIEAGAATPEQEQQAKQLAATISQTEQQLPVMKAELDASEQTLSQALPGLTQWKTQLDAAAVQISGAEKQIDAGEKQLSQGEKKLQKSEEELASAKEQISEGERQLKEAEKKLASEEKKIEQARAELADGKRQLAEAEKEIADGEKEIEDGEAEIEENEQKLADGEREYEDAKRDAEEEIADGEEKLADAKEEIDKIERAEWTVSDRSDVLEYDGYGENADRMRNIGRVFPVIFFLVAALISLTTMTRMVEEERTQIGTLKALGYGKASIAAKYVAYALLATLSGSIFGVLVGEKILPYIIIRAYGIMYHHMDAVRVPYNPVYGVIAAAVAVFCTMFATIAACAKELQAWPAVLMRPPSPRQGKRVMIERLPFLWKRLSFTWKSTVRNLFRYKKRFFMTIMGIGGCMGLLLVGFGLKDSIMDVARLQYKDIQIYDGIVILDEDADSGEREELLRHLSEDSAIEGFTDVYMKRVDLCSETGKRETYLMVAPDAAKLESFVRFRDRTTKEAYHLGDEGAILTEKTGLLLKASAGESVWFAGEKRDVRIPVQEICENYMSHYLYMTEALYVRLYGEKPEYNSILFRAKDRGEGSVQAAGERILQCEGALSVTYTSNTEKQIERMLTSLNSVILVLIISAGMLAFVVLYNLNNININERRRELATIKVLGFYDREVSAYVYRENILLTVLGSIFGVFFGIVLHRFIIVTVEVDVCMFGRNINPPSFVYAVLLTFVFSALVNIAMHYRMKKIDMVESLKSVE